jgi:hypothetical protein
MTHLEGVYEAGEYALEQFLATDSGGAYYRTVYGPDRHPALIKLVAAESCNAEAQLELWRRTASLSHPGLLQLLDYGRSAEYLYAVFEFPDDNLLSAGQLAEEQAQEVLGAIVPALRYLHMQGLSHVSVDAGHIVAVGESIKLSTDGLRVQSGDTSDLRALGVLIYEMLTGIRVAPGEAPDLARAPRGLRPVLRELCGRSGFAGRQFARVMSYAAGGAALTALILVIANRSTPDAAATATPAARPPAAVTQPVIQPVSAPTPAPVPPAAAKPVVAQAHNSAGPANWRVVAYTYNRYSDAEKKVKTLNTRWSGFHAEVFAPHGKGQAPFFVGLGGRMTKEDAQSFYRRAMAKGLPRDTFTRNFSN